MHESSLTSNLMRKIESIARQQNARAVTLVRVRIGALCMVSADHFKDHFTLAAQGTVAEGTRVIVEESAVVDDEHACDVLLESLEIEK